MLTIKNISVVVALSCFANASFAQDAGQGDWAGFYAGLEIAGGSSQISYGDESADLSDFNQGGFHAGYLADMGVYVIGGELEYSSLDFDIGGRADVLNLKGRIGYDADRILPYAVAGLSTLKSNDEGPEFSENGFAYGVGVDFKLTDKFTVGAEYLHHQFSDVLDTSGFDLNADTLALRASYHF